ncbi:hypothetical protein EN814_24000 [Mesorhizobium sp. M2D.F.Ca.ET.171.01.1.1]|uniref:hypothetical protein n=1 Tax=unclassified Mesorhizobium TaxID=325217 RepID=UPI00109231BB|nr:MULTISPECIES: hypothetical protein [unclassified Mesorhizobium]TGS92708.1 hypothetical protein EN821_24015 [Mesorhizobium sp. M2D.F.Ca.ET.178.01.1.1]TGT08513.1 hypothetical protein EN814_24000 [Mesorhizobium sp. M2D.F.Ca.ET.171.01.1.1]
MNHSSFASARQTHEPTVLRDGLDFEHLGDDELDALESLEMEVAESLKAQARVDNKVKRTRVKSVYRDALFRPLFQAVAISQTVAADGGTSVTSVTPSHPLYRVIRLDVTPANQPPAFYKPESLTDAEEVRHARFWRAYEVILPRLRQHQVPADWRDLADPSRLEWFHHAARHSGPLQAFTLQLSADTEALARGAKSTAGWLSKRITRRLRDLLARDVDCWFALEMSPRRRLHLHGELQIAPGEAEVARKALRLAAGEWDKVRQHQAYLKDRPSVVWTNYSAKDWTSIRRLKRGWFAKISRPINGEWFFATKPIRRLANELYFIQRREVIKLMKTLPARR